MELPKIKTKNFFGLNNETEYDFEEPDEEYLKVLDFLLGKLDIKAIPTYRDLESISEKKEVIIKAEAVFDTNDKIKIIRTKIKLKRIPLYSPTLRGVISPDETKIYTQKFDYITIDKVTMAYKHSKHASKEIEFLIKWSQEHNKQPHTTYTSSEFLNNEIKKMFEEYAEYKMEGLKHD